ncbi:hypothetical protein N8H71_27385 [Pseudomonas koreensis]|uniref:hypothetical protein n=1 Tax=Pseudomonas koreensis TaxID=198620 RepID=UPI0021C70BFA|nr:hypothetical protein [Pseudomonas koreensis]MCU0075332.1 hypothetical protein [Pseudomonas koreensis]
MATPTTPPPFFIAQSFQSTEFLPAGTPGVNGNLLTAAFQRNPGPYKKASGTRFIFPPTPNVVPGSLLTIYADRVMLPNGQPYNPPPPTITFPPVTITSPNSATMFSLPYQNNVTGTDGFGNDPGYEIWGEISIGGTVYAVTRSFYGFWLP